MLSKGCVIQKVCYLKGVLRYSKGVMFQKVCYCVIFKAVLTSEGMLNYTPWVAKRCVIKRCVIKRCVNSRCVFQHTKVCQGAF